LRATLVLPNVIEVGKIKPEHTMTRLIFIGVLIVLAFLLIRYGTNEKLQKWVVIVLLSAFALYTASLVVTELIR
jgi:Ca2+/Na+ antiporter